MNESLVEKFLDEARKVGADVHRCGATAAIGESGIKNFSSPAELVPHLQRVAAGGRIRTSALPEEIMTELDGLKISPDGPAADTSLCISIAEAGIAATGSLLLYLPDPDERALTALATKHAVFLRSNSIIPTLRDLSATLKEQLSSGSNYLSVTTGPSRTADIERVLTIGVHGPKELHILILEGE